MQTFEVEVTLKSKICVRGHSERDIKDKVDRMPEGRLVRLLQEDGSVSIGKIKTKTVVPISLQAQTEVQKSETNGSGC